MLASSPLAAGPIASASQAVQTAGGAGVVAVNSSGGLSLVLLWGATAIIEFRSEGIGRRGATLIGSMPVQVATEGVMHRGATGSASFEVVVALDSDFRVATKVEAVFSVQVDSALDGRAVTPKTGSGKAFNEVVSRGSEPGRASHIPNMQSSIWVNANGKANLIASAPVSRAVITVHSTGEFTFGDYHYGSGRALAAALFSTGSIQALPYVYASGSAAVSVKMIDHGYGIPPIPSLFISAPGSRTMYAPPSGRTMYAGKNRRTLP